MTYKDVALDPQNFTLFSMLTFLSSALLFIYKIDPDISGSYFNNDLRLREKKCSNIVQCMIFPSGNWESNHHSVYVG